MKWAHAWFALLGVGLCVAAGCGGKVFVDLPGNGGGGAGGTASGNPTMSSSSGGITCSGDLECSQDSDGSCFCAGLCNGQELAVECKAAAGGLACNCIENEIIIAKCEDPFSASCGIESGCCAAFFPDAPGQ